MGYKKSFELIVRGDKTKNTKNAVIQRKYKNQSIFDKNAKLAKISSAIYFFFRFFKTE